MDSKAAIFYMIAARAMERMGRLHIMSMATMRMSFGKGHRKLKGWQKVGKREGWRR